MPDVLPVLHIPLSRLAVCIACEATFDIAFGKCPACTSEQIALVTAWFTGRARRS